MTIDYVLSNQWERERERLDALTGRYDPASLAFCRDAGLVAGALVLEVGPGTGRFAQLMADVVGPTGEVVAVDIDPTLAESLPGRTFALVSGDVRDGTLPEGPFDLVHARLVIGHLVDRAAALQTLRQRLRPGGWLVVEDFDRVTASTCDPASDVYLRVTDAIWSVMAAGGFDGRFGREMPNALAAAGFTDITTTGTVDIIPGSRTDGVPQWELLLDQLEAPVLGIVGAEDVAAFHALMHDPGLTVFGPTVVRSRGRR